MLSNAALLSAEQAAADINPPVDKKVLQMKKNLAATLLLLLMLTLTISCGKKKEVHKPAAAPQLNEVQMPAADPLLKHVAVSLGWDDPVETGNKMDLDISAFLLGPNGKTRFDDETDFCFYNNETVADGAVKHTDDNKTIVKGDSETITAKLSKLPSDLDKVIFTVSFYNDEKSTYKFKQAGPAYVRIVDLDTQNELARYYLKDVAPDESAMIFGELYRSGSDWKFRVLKKGFPGGLLALARSFGIDAYMPAAPN